MKRQRRVFYIIYIVILYAIVFIFVQSKVVYITSIVLFLYQKIRTNLGKSFTCFIFKLQT